jgi:preprotein translocase subunit YajC
MLSALLLLAQEPQPNPEPSFAPFLPLILIAVVFYFLIFLPGRREKQRQQAMITAVKKNDKIVTNAGIIGTIVNMEEGGDEVTIRSDETKLRILKSSIFRVLTAKEPAKDAKEETNITVKS